MNSMVPNGIQTKHNNKMIAKKTSAKKEDVPVFLMKVSVRFLCVLIGSGCVAEHSLCLGGGGGGCGIGFGRRPVPSR
jgi:hypothetical protein